MKELKLEITSVIDIDVNEILLTIIEGEFTLDEAINDYVAGLDDCYYYLIGDEEIKQIKNYIIKNM